MARDLLAGWGMRRVRWLALVLGMTLAGVAGAEDAPVNPYLDEPVPAGTPDLEPVDPYAEPVKPAKAPPPAAPPVRVPQTVMTRPAPPPVEVTPDLVDPYEEPTLLMAYAPIRVVAIMLETGQTLLWDEKDNLYRLGRVGEEVHGWRIMAVETERVVVSQAGVVEELPLTPAPTVKKTAKGKKGAPPTIVVAIPEAAKPEAAPVITPPVTTPPPVEVEPAKPAAPTEQKVSLARAELDRELTDFDKLMTTVSVSAVKGGGFKLTRVDEKSFVHKMGLRSGDVVLSVAGEQVSTVDDAARVYARLRVAKSFNVEVDRGGARVTLKVEVK